MTSINDIGVQTREELTTELRTMMKDRDQRKLDLSKIEARLFALVYRWVILAVEEEAAKNQMGAILRLSKTLRRTETSVSGWFYCGKTMAEFKMNPKRVSASAVRELTIRQHDVTKAELHQLVDIIKKAKEGASKDVRKILGKSSKGTNLQAARKVEYLRRNGNLTKTRAKMELMAVKTFFTGYFGKDVNVSVFDAKDGKTVLLETS